MRAQVAVEFLMTYGWAMMVVLGAISSLIYFGVVDLDMFVTEKCEFSSGIYCIDGIADTTGVKVAIQNGMAIDLENVEVSIPECGTAAGAGLLSSGEQGNYEASCTLTAGTVFKGRILFNYTNPDSGFDHTKIGQIVYRVT